MPVHVPVAQEVEITAASAPVVLHGWLEIPDRPLGLVLFAHGSGSGRHSPRNHRVAAVLHELSLATLLFDLLTEAEETDAPDMRFEIPFLAGRRRIATAWAAGRPDLGGLPLGYFGASTGAAAALAAAAEEGARVGAIVSRGGRPDLAPDALARVAAPTLLIVGGDDLPVLQLNRAAKECLAHGRLEVVPGAGHLFEEPGALDAVAASAGAWFLEHLGGGRAP